MLAERVKQWDNEGYTGGLQRGLQDGQRAVVLRLLERKYGALSEEHRQRVAETAGDALLQIAERVLTAQSVEEALDGA